MELVLPSFILSMISRTVAREKAAPEVHYPSIKRYGGVMLFPDSVRPEKKLKYKVIFDIARSPESNSEILPGLSHVAAFINSFPASGIKDPDMRVAAVLRGGTMKAALTNSAYADHYYMDNPNTGLIGELRKAGVELLVCAQSLFREGFSAAHVNPDVRLSFSAAIALATYQMKGYALVPV